MKVSIVKVFLPMAFFTQSLNFIVPYEKKMHYNLLYNNSDPIYGILSIIIIFSLLFMVKGAIEMINFTNSIPQLIKEESNSLECEVKR